MVNELSSLPEEGALAGKRVVIFGASGFIGTALARRIADRGASAVCVDIAPPREIIPGHEYIVGDVRDLNSLTISNVSALFNLAAVHTTPGHDDHEYYDTNVSGAIAVSDFAIRNSVEKVLFTSSISVYGPSEDLKTEKSTPAPVSAYGKSKLQAERIHSQALGSFGASLTIIRPAVVFGSGEGGNFTRMASLLRKGFFVFPGRRDTIKSCIYVEDLIDLMFFAMGEEGKEKIVNGCYDERSTLESIVLKLKNYYFKSAKLVDIPYIFVVAAARLLSVTSGLGFGIHPERVMKLVNSTNIDPRWAAERMFFANRNLDRGLQLWANATSRQFK